MAREEMEVNYFGTLAMCRAFAPVLKANGGGAIVNVLSVLARVGLPLMGSLCASKAASLSLTQCVRAELAGQGTRVVAAMPGAIDTRMTANFPPPKMPPADAAREILDAFEAGDEEIYAGDMARGIAAGLAADPKAVEKQLSAYL
jgi:NAD(P)-dependent dehydrogenase (short-subunit alcohol dehydrogenase family)